MKSKPIAIHMVEGYEFFGELSDEEVNAILNKRLPPKLGNLSEDEIQLVLEMRGGILHRGGSSLDVKKELKRVIIWATSKYSQSYYDLISVVQNQGFMVKDLSKVLQNMEEQGHLSGKKSVSHEGGMSLYKYRATDLGKDRFLKEKSDDG